MTDRDRAVRRRGTATLVLAVLLVALTGCSAFLGPPTRTESTPRPENAPLGFADYFGQTLHWEDCGGGLQCSTASAPLDWSTPDGQSINLALARRPATTSDVRGSILIDPGGPGASAVSYLRNSGSRVIGADVLEHYDIVAVDPRGVGGSSGVDCLGDTELDEFLYDEVPGDRGSAEWIAATRSRNAAFGAACAATTGALAGRLATPNVARDYDLARALLGDADLNYLGFSYGTLIGAIYADLFPHRVGRMVLDGAMDPASSAFDLTRGQAVGFERALTAYLDDCLTRDACPFTGSTTAARSQVAALLARVDADPIRHSDGRQLNGPTLLTAIIHSLYRSSSWPSLSQMLRSVQDGETQQAFAFADDYNSRTPDGRYESDMMEAFAAVTCVDYVYTADPSIIQMQNDRLVADAPTVGPWWTFGDLSCDQWPYPPGRVPAPVSADGVAPVLVVGTTGDPATPYEWAQSLAAQLDGSRLITFEGDVHTAYNSSACVRELVDAYFVDGSLPDQDARC